MTVSRRRLRGLAAWMAPAIFAASFSACSRPAAPSGGPGYAIRPVPFSDVAFVDSFWAPKQEVNRTASISACYAQYDKHGEPPSTNIFEGAAAMLLQRDDPALRARTDGYFRKSLEGIRLREPRGEEGIGISGYLFEAGPLYSQATGDPLYRAKAIEVADLVDAAYGPGKKSYISGHEGLKMGLVRLSEQTGDERYWKLARFFLDERGRDRPDRAERQIDREYIQDHLPVTQQTEAVGHAVRATYLYTPMTDIAALTGEPAYRAALDAIWTDLVSRKLALIGGLGAVRYQEKFGPAYDLPNVSCWNETCAACGNIYWNRRMFQLEGDAKFIDVLERTLYNGFLSGVSQSGDRFFYQNVLKAFGTYGRFEWINVPCCPPNLVRTMATVGGYVYATGPRDLYVNLFAGSDARADVGGTAVTVTQRTQYPWDGAVKIGLAPAKARRFALRVRIPGWARGTPVPSDLYAYAPADGARPSLAVNGTPVEIVLDKGYAVVDRTWKAGDVVDLTLPMPVRRVLAHPNVKEDEGLVAFERGPLVFCAEGPDNGGRVLNAAVPDDAAFTAEFRSDVLGGVQTISGDALEAVREADGTVGRRPRRLTLVPYYAWANRGLSEMAVWLPRDPARARAWPVTPPAPVTSVSQSGGIVLTPTGYGDQNDNLAAVFDGFDPSSSADESQTYFRVRPKAGTPARIEYAFARPTRVSSAQVYFVDDRRFCRLPESWRILAKVGGAWRPVKALGPYAVEKDRFNEIAFEPVDATAVRLELRPAVIHYRAGEIGPPEAMFIDADVDWSECGIIEFRVK